ncbi:MAG: hypothetical protein JSV84_04710 [Gemmatimonadota bacterium]|nr:MAG: hypothetical protein JSV84_04710 [Gemmatimonadota bacterium]
MRIQRFFTVCLLCTAIILSTRAFGVETSIWEVRTANDFEKGEPADVSIRSDGQVLLASSLELLYDTGELYVWCLAHDSKGNIYAGTGNNGRVFKINKNGVGALFFDSPELEILSVVVDKNDNLFAGTAPDGIIYKISPEGEATTFFETREQYVWALLFDRQGNLYAGTGIGGKIFKIAPTGDSELVYDSNETHIMTFVLDDNNNLYAGSEGTGIIYRISPHKDVFVLYDAPQKEIHSLTLTPDGTLYAGATEAVIRVKKVPVPTDRPDQGGERSQEESEDIQPAIARVAQEKSAVYEIGPEGIVKTHWASSALLLSLIVNDDGSLTIGTGDEGKLYSVLEDGTSLSFAQSSESQILALRRDSRGGTLLATGNHGKIFRLASDYAQEGTIVSDVFDTQTLSKWGKISWQADLPSGTRIAFETRSGNSEHPDDTWSDWSDAHTNSQGEPISSPSARFIQWRAKLTTSNPSHTPLLKGVSVAYLQRNMPPEIMSITINASGQKSGRSIPRISSKPEEISNNRKSNNGARSVDWKAHDPNGDNLTYTILFRGIDEHTWKVLKGDETSISYTWDTESVPDGRYILKVVASDSPNNPPNTALTAEKISEPFTVDNTPPRVLNVKATPGLEKSHLISATTEDETSIITRAEYSLDAGEWTMIFPEDEIFDSKTEMISFTTEPLKPGEHTLTIRATDDAGNIGAGKVIFTVK